MRKTDYSKLDPMFIERWSPRAFSSDPLSNEDIHTLFEAARWSPSCFNKQPWRFVYARSEGDLKQFRSILADANRVWASSAPLLIIVFSSRTFARNGKPNRWLDFDSGAAWMALALQARQLDLDCHAMGGFDQHKAYEIANADPEQHNAICVIAAGRKAAPDQLPDELKAREMPSDRKSITEFIAEGKMI